MSRIIFLFIILLRTQAFAHEGPPYPVLVDKDLARVGLSIWADPDVGDGTFFIYLEEKKQGDLPELLNIEALAALRDETLAGPFIGERKKVLERETSSISARHIYELHIPFTQKGDWRVDFHLDGSVVTLTIPVTPPGPTRWEFALYFVPFICFGFIWLKLIFKKHQLSKEKQA